jgi:ribosomal protein S12 methylthiotransferase accessory factor
MNHDEQLEKALETYKSSMPKGELKTFRIDGIDQLGIPIVDATFLGEDDSYGNGLGYGATPVEAEVGAYGELYEEYFISQAVLNIESVEASFAQMQIDYKDQIVIDPLTLVLPAGSNYDKDLQLKWVQINRLADDAAAWIPLEFLGNYNEYVAYPNQLITAITNGCGAGETFERALLHGLLELLQRDGNADCFRALDQGKVIDLDGISEKTLQLMQELEEKGLKVIPKLAQITCGCVSLYAVGDDLSDDDFPFTVAACGEAADPDFDHAIRKAVLECASSHSRKIFYHSSMERKTKITPEGYAEENLKLIDLEAEEQRALRTHVEWLEMGKTKLREKLKDSVFLQKEVVSPKNMPHFDKSSIEDRLNQVIKSYKKEGLDIYYYRATLPDHPIQVVRAIVPGIEMEFGSYHRIGARGVQRLLDRKDKLISTVSGPGKKRIRLTAEKEKELGGRFWLDTDALDEKINDLYPLYREPNAHSAMHALKTGYFSNE